MLAADTKRSKGATHIHVMAHNVSETTVRTNGTLLGSNSITHASHVGQIFFDQDLISLVEATTPYNTNTQDITLNSDDQILSDEAADMDPFVEWVQLGEDITDGIMAWISIGIVSTADDEVTSAATVYKSGGVANENSMGAWEAEMRRVAMELCRELLCLLAARQHRERCMLMFLATTCDEFVQRQRPNRLLCVERFAASRRDQLIDSMKGLVV